MRVTIIGNSGAGKSTLARRLGTDLYCPPTEVDSLMWQPGWTLTPESAYNAEHARLISGERWIIDGLGSRDSIPARLERSTHVVLVDLPLWIHFWLAAERQLAWTNGTIEHPPAGVAIAPPTRALFQTIGDVDQNWMPEIRRLVAIEEQRAKHVYRINTLEALDGFTLRE